MDCMKFVTFSVVITVSYGLIYWPQKPPKIDWWALDSTDPDLNKNVSQLITSKGYPVEEHWVQTDDGYIIGIQRIPRGRNENRYESTARKSVVFLMHGVAESSTDFVWNFQNQSLGFVLADSGYDVWLGNVRGNTYGLRHVSLSHFSREFWAFSWDEMAAYDLASSLNLIVNKTGSRSIRYIGFSLGVNKIMALLSSQPKYQEIIHSVIAMAPAVYIMHLHTQLRTILPFFMNALHALGLEPFGLFTHSWTSRAMCRHSWLRDVCLNFIPTITGPSSELQLNRSRLPVYLSHIPASMSSRVIRHEIQQACSEKFSMYDFGRHENRKRYGRDTPPTYPIELIKTPVFILYGENDQMVPPKDVKRFADRLPNVVAIHRVEDEKWSHLDFIWGVEAYRYVHSHVLKFLKY